MYMKTPVCHVYTFSQQYNCVASCQKICSHSGPLNTREINTRLQGWAMITGKQHPSMELIWSLYSESPPILPLFHELEVKSSQISPFCGYLSCSTQALDQLNWQFAIFVNTKENMKTYLSNNSYIMFKLPYCVYRKNEKFSNNSEQYHHSHPSNLWVYITSETV